VNPWDVIVAAVLLSLERLCYVWIWLAPDVFRFLCAQVPCAWAETPMDVVEKLFYAFKILQGVVFLGWCYIYSHGLFWPLAGESWSLGLGGVLLLVGQILNVSVFWRLGRVGVFYGKRFGYDVSWYNTFPFSFLEHPQYVGALLSIWGFFLIMRFPYDDWAVLPLIETVYYVLGAYYERED